MTNLSLLDAVLLVLEYYSIKILYCMHDSNNLYLKLLMCVAVSDHDLFASYITSYSYVTICLTELTTASKWL